MRDATERRLTDMVIQAMAGTQDRRLLQIMTALVRHLHDFIREVELTEEEWFAAIRFLTATGRMCDDKRQEFILLSDTLGVSMLVDAINHRIPAGATESTVLGPFYRQGAPERSLGEDIAAGEAGMPTYVSGRVTDPAGEPIAGAVLDVWQTDEEGFYDVQRPERGSMRLRGRFRTNANGRYHFRTIKPVSYPIPDDGPVGKMLKALGRHPWRPAHLHFIISAPGFQAVTTHLFVEGDRYLGSDAVFGVKPSLIAGFLEHPPGHTPDGSRSEVPFCTLEYDFGLQPA